MRTIEVSMTCDELEALGTARRLEDDSDESAVLRELLASVLPPDLPIDDPYTICAQCGLEPVVVVNARRSYLVLDEVEGYAGPQMAIARSLAESIVADRVAEKIDLGTVDGEYRYSLSGPDIHNEWMVEVGLNFTGGGDVSDGYRNADDIADAIRSWVKDYDTDTEKVRQAYRNVEPPLPVVLYADGMDAEEVEDLCHVINQVGGAVASVERIYRSKDIRYDDPMK